MTVTKARHTPGPWTIEDPMGPEIISIISRGDKPVYEWQHVAQLSTEPEDKDDIQPRQARANARLIAAAPDLLAALKDVVAVADRKTDEFDRARAAIAKAEAAP